MPIEIDACWDNRLENPFLFSSFHILQFTKHKPSFIVIAGGLAFINSLVRSRRYEVVTALAKYCSQYVP